MSIIVSGLIISQIQLLSSIACHLGLGSYVHRFLKRDSNQTRCENLRSRMSNFMYVYLVTLAENTCKTLFM